MNISEIAKLAGVSPAAVSRYLNNGYLSQEKKELIEKVIKETGYKPSQQAATLRTGKTKLIGMIIPKINSSSISRIVAGVSDVLSQEGYQLILANTNNQEDLELDYVETFVKTNVAGIIHLGTIETPRHKKTLKKLQVPIVILGQKVDGASCIYHDDYHAAFSMTELVISKGHKNIGYIGVTDKDRAVGSLRKQGFLDALKEHNLPIREDAILTGSFQIENGQKNIPILLERYKGIDAVVCATDTIALGVIKYCNQNQIAVPDKLGVSGFGDSLAASILSPSLTTVHFHYKECGKEGARMLLDLIENPDMPHKSVMLGYDILENESI